MAEYQADYVVVGAGSAGCVVAARLSETGAKVLVLGWGSTFGSIGAAVRRIRVAGSSVAQAHLRNLSPFPANLGDVLASYDKVLVPEINLGQLSLVLRGRYLTDVISYNRVRGLPFRAAELAGVIQDVIDNV